MSVGRVIFTQDSDFLRIHAAGYRHADSSTHINKCRSAMLSAAWRSRLRSFMPLSH